MSTIVFLAADKPIVKRYELNDQNELIKHSFPNIFEVTSHQEQITSLQDFTTALETHAKKGHCLLKGTIGRDIKSESRAGSTDPDALTSWICLDLDGIKGFANLDNFLASIGCGEVDYVVQWSSSMGLEGNTDLRCHVFMNLAKETHPKILKYWLMSINLSNPLLRSQLELTKTGNSLKWSLDVTTCQNDKLLYIAPPKFGKGIRDPFARKPRIAFVPKVQRTLTLPYPIPNREALAESVDTRLNELRVNAGMPKRRKTSYKFANGVEFISKPDTATITGIKTERGFVYFNLNGGDSWGYYHPENDPSFVYNFKGEPAYRTEELLPEYWAKVNPQQQANSTTASGVIYLAFRDFKTGIYYNGFFDQNTNDLTLAPARNETQLRHFLKQYNQVLGEFVPDWDLTWEPQNPLVVDLQNQRVNTYTPSSIILNSSPKLRLAPFPTITRVVSHALGNDTETVDYFWNWLASIVQNLCMTGTAWILQGIQGTGKGLIYNKILMPLFGTYNTVSKRMEEMESEFTGFMENKFIVFIDEIEKIDSIFQSRLSAKLRTLIAEPEISIRKMHTLPYMTKNYSNIVMSSNQTTPVDIPPDDRRHNVGLFQTEKLQITSQEIDVAIPNELPALADFLKSYPVDPAKLRTPLKNSARATLISTNRTALDTAIDALNAGDLAFFWDHLPSSKNSAMDNMSAIKLMGFRSLVIELVTNLDPILTRDDLYVLLDWCVGKIPNSPNKFTSLLKHHRVYLTQIWKNKRNVRGMRVDWKPDPDWLKGARQEILEKVV